MLILAASIAKRSTLLTANGCTQPKGRSWNRRRIRETGPGHRTRRRTQT